MITLYFASLHLLPGYFQTHNVNFSIKHGTALFKELNEITVSPKSLVLKKQLKTTKIIFMPLLQTTFSTG